MRWAVAALAMALCYPSAAAAQAAARDTGAVLVVPARVFDAPAGTTHDGWAVLVRGDRIVSALHHVRFVMKGGQVVPLGD